MRQKCYFVYIMTNKIQSVLYIGMTSKLKERIWQHKQKIRKGFTEKYNICKLVHYEVFDNPEAAIKKEKQIKKWERQWKVNLIEENTSVSATLKEQLFQWVDAAHNYPTEKITVTPSPELQEKLRALGYISEKNSEQ